MERNEGEVVASVASFGGLSLPPGLTARAVLPAAPTPTPRDQPRQPQQPRHDAAFVAFAPAAMSALIEAQERLSHPGAPIVRQQTSHKIDQLIERMGGASTSADAPFGVRQLEVARQALAQNAPSFAGLDLRA